ncbi:hypothetical protein J4460_03380 [Candidatus Woesearchaeota archaeon]|nr:MAG: hypothetical protein QS99_C0008G0046 [archaeon GW2011_AR4]MBS3129690.1 hypothetical protein [Candidatus Woesearchaeota archaeon]HIH38794.1 hypothetical protein [Candidatus Woesearchaeota archaeon]HIH49209.1 hypothetical protein [Candidatus Woesearchaeota archaeon]HIJ03352.1 hypothetical protein [Candidatus Woesearchaeota archaeon]
MDGYVHEGIGRVQQQARRLNEVLERYDANVESLGNAVAEVCRLLRVDVFPESFDLLMRARELNMPITASASVLHAVGMDNGALRIDMEMEATYLGRRPWVSRHPLVPTFRYEIRYFSGMQSKNSLGDELTLDGAALTHFYPLEVSLKSGANIIIYTTDETKQTNGTPPRTLAFLNRFDTSSHRLVRRASSSRLTCHITRALTIVSQKQGPPYITSDTHVVVPGEQQKPCLVYEALAFLALGYGGHMLALGLANFETKLEQRVAMAEAYHQAYGIGSMDRELELDAGERFDRQLADPAGSDDTPVRMDGEEPPAEDTTITNGNSEW